jgi:hypothetical protein
MQNKFGLISGKAFLLLLLLCLLGLVFSCGKGSAQSDKYSLYESTVDSSKPLAFGDNRDIYVFCDADVWKLMQDYLKRSLERETFIVVNEKYFELIKSDIKDIDELMKYKNLLFLGDLKSKGAVSAHMRNSMQKRMLERVQNSGAEMFVARNRWVKDQLIVYMLGSDLENLAKLNMTQADRLYNLFLSRLGERLAYQAYQTKLIPEEFFTPYPFALKVPSSYRLFSDDRQNRFLSLLYRVRSETSDLPDRYLSIYYENMPQDSVNVDWLIARRQALAGKYFEGDQFDPKFIRSEKMAFGKYQAWRIIGPWKNEKHDIGGGFQAFAFYDGVQKKAYLIDNSVYYPAGDKLPELLELQKLSQTFRTK